MQRNPYLSVIITSRNDDHGGNMLRRMQVTIRGLLEQLEKYAIESELILVDWNPPKDKPFLKDVIKWPSKLRYCTIRVIVASPSIHKRYKYHDKIPMHAVVAVNSGIRRSRGQFILPGTIDLLYPDEIVSYIASKNLNDDERCRVDRYDVNRNVLQYNTLAEQLDYCRQNIIKINSYSPQGKSNLPELHTDTCGDFQLMSKHYWHLLRGYYEVDIMAAHVDGLLSYASYRAGVKEIILNEPLRIYHIDHDDKFNDKLKVRQITSLWRKFMGTKIVAEVYGVPTLTHPDYQSLCRDIIAGKRPYIFNNSAWGLGRETLPEFTINAAEWDKEYEKK